jgi:hypothetical protein
MTLIEDRRTKSEADHGLVWCCGRYVIVTDESGVRGV